MKKIRHELSQSSGYPSGKSLHTDRPSRLGGIKKYGLVGGGILAVIVAALFVLTLKVALIITGALLVAAALIAAYIYFVRKF
jgi:hypothetical protein